LLCKNGKKKSSTQFKERNPTKGKELVSSVSKSKRFKCVWLEGANKNVGTFHSLVLSEVKKKKIPGETKWKKNLDSIGDLA